MRFMMSRYDAHHVRLFALSLAILRVYMYGLYSKPLDWVYTLQGVT